jgi:small subunit ribosomal protein S1
MSEEPASDEPLSTPDNIAPAPSESIEAHPEAVCPGCLAPEVSAPATEGANGAFPRGRPRLQLEELEVGMRTVGRIMAIANYGLFVDVGAVTDGLVHVSQFPRRRRRKRGPRFELGQSLDVWIKDVDLRAQRISLSLRPPPARPMREMHVGDVLEGTVTTVTKYGAFVDVGAETDGLVHVSQLSDGYIGSPVEVVSRGQLVQVRIQDIDLPRERISLSMIGLAQSGRQAATDD